MNEKFITKPMTFATEADALSYLGTNQSPPTNRHNNQWIFYVLGGAVIVVLIVYISYMSQRQIMHSESQRAQI